MTADVAWLLGTGYVAQSFTFIASIAIRSLLGPTAMGYVAVLGLVAVYAPFLTLGLTQAAEREVAIEIGRGRQDIAERLESTTAVIALTIGVCVGLAAIPVAIAMTTGSTTWAIVAASVVISAQQIAVIATIRLRTRLRFRSLGIWSAGGSVATSAGTLVGAAVADLPGAIIGAVAGFVVQAAVLARTARWPRMRFEASAVRRLAPLAPSFLAVGLSAVLLNSVDQIAVAGLLGPTALGLYSTAYLGNAFLVRVPNLIGSALYPRLQYQHGSHGDVVRLHDTVRRTTDATLFVILPVIAASSIGLPVVVRLFIPDFADAIPAMRLLLVGVAGLAFAAPASQMLVTIGRVWTQVTITLATAAAMGLAYIAADRLGLLTIVAAALVDVVAYLVFGIATQAGAASAAGRRWTSLILPTLLIVVPFLVTSLAGSAIDTATDRGVPMAVGALIQVAVFTVSFSSCGLLYLRSRPRLRDDLRLVIGAALRRSRSPRPNDRSVADDPRSGVE